MVSIAMALPSRFPFGRGNEKQVAQDVGFLAAWSIQCHAAAFLVVGLSAFFGVWQAVLMMVLWALLATHIYETARRKGLKDVFETPGDRMRQRSGIWGWVVFAVKTYILDIKQVLYAWALESKIRERNGSWLSHWLAILGALMFLGVLASHHTLQQAGLSSSQTYLGNMVGRLLNIPVKVVETTLTATPLLLALSFAVSLIHRVV